MPRDDSTGRPVPPPQRPRGWSSLDYAWASAIALPLLAAGPFFLAVPFWVGTLMEPVGPPAGPVHRRT